MPSPRRLTAERARLAELHVDVARRAVRTVIRKKNLPMKRWPGVEWDDAMSVGYEALCQAAIDWNTEAGPFEPFVYHRVMFRIMDWIRAAGPYDRKGKWRPHANSVSWVYDGGAVPYSDGGVPTENLLSDDQLVEDHAGLLMGRQFVNYCLSLLPERQRYVMEQTIVHNRTAPSLAKEMGITEDSVYMLRTKAIRRLRRDDEVAYTLL